MQHKWIVIAAAALAAWPAALAAQGTPRPPREPRGFAYSFNDNRGRIGVVVRSDADSETDKIGARIEGVTPGGPAAKAEDEEESGPGNKLVELARGLEPGDTVQLEYRRGSDGKKATLVAERLPRLEMFRFPEPPGMAMPRMPDMNFEFFGSPWGDLEVVSLNPDLGEYFGTKEGVLVVKAPADSGLPLKGGDVILSIGGRRPTSPSHAMRILRSYEPGETVALDIMRKQKRVTVSWKVPERGERRLRYGHEHEDQSRFRLLPLRGRTRIRSV